MQRLGDRTSFFWVVWHCRFTCSFTSKAKETATVWISPGKAVLTPCCSILHLLNYVKCFSSSLVLVYVAVRFVTVLLNNLVKIIANLLLYWVFFPNWLMRTTDSFICDVSLLLLNSTGFLRAALFWVSILLRQASLSYFYKYWKTEVCPLTKVNLVSELH